MTDDQNNSGLPADFNAESGNQKTVKGHIEVGQTFSEYIEKMAAKLTQESGTPFTANDVIIMAFREFVTKQHDSGLNLAQEDIDIIVKQIFEGSAGPLPPEQ